MEINKKQQWTFLTNHTHILYLIYGDNNITIRDIAIKVGITERAVLNIISDLTVTEYLSVKKVGRNNQYSINTEKMLRHPIENHCSIGEFLNAIQKTNNQS